MSDNSTITQTVEIPASPEKVYEGFTNPIIHEEMTGAGATGKAEIGGDFTAWDGYIFGKYLELVPGKKIVQEWSTSEWPDDAEPSRLELTFEPTADSTTKLTMVHSNVPAEQEAQYTTGWPENYWVPMTDYFEAR